MNPPLAAKRPLALGLAAAILLASPGLPAYRAFAQTMAVPADVSPAPLAVAPLLDPLVGDLGTLPIFSAVAEPLTSLPRASLSSLEPSALLENAPPAFHRVKPQAAPAQALVNMPLVKIHAALAAPAALPNSAAARLAAGRQFDLFLRFGLRGFSRLLTEPDEPVPTEAAEGGLRALESRPAPTTPAKVKSSKQGLGLKLAIGVPTAAVATAAIIHSGVVPIAAVSGSLVLSILLHETAHLWVLRRLGDDTAKKHGGGSLNPLKHIDPWGTLVVPVATLLASSSLFHIPVLFGWARPVAVDFNKLPDPKRDPAVVALAGPAVNLAAAALFGAALGILPALGAISAGGAAAFILANIAKMNLALGVFNLIPLPNLDGGKLLVRWLPASLYDRWVRNPKLPARYQGLFRRFYEGPSNLLSRLHVHDQPTVNGLTRAASLIALAGFYAVSLGLLGSPFLFMMLACSYDYYCIREKIQNENAVNELIGILQGFAGELARAAQESSDMRSEINPEETEHVLKNALEETIDRIADSEGFSGLSDAEKWARFEAAYKEEALRALKLKGMSADDPETIRRLLESERVRGFFEKIHGWIDQHSVWQRWRSPDRKKRLRDDITRNDDSITNKPRFMEGGGTGALALLLFAGAAALAQALGAAHGSALLASLAAGLPLLTASLQPGRSPPRNFNDALDDPALRFSDKEKGFLRLLLREMKLESKPPVIGRTDEMAEMINAVTSPRGEINSFILIGAKGVGKTAVAEKLAQSILLSESGGSETFQLESMQGRYLVKLNLGRLLAGDDPVGGMDALIQLLSRFNDPDQRKGSKVILFIDEIHQIFQHPRGSQLANLLKEPLRDGELTMIAATTDEEYKRYFRQDEAFQDRLIPLWISEATPAETLRMLQGARGYYEDRYGAGIEEEALRSAAEDSKYDQELRLPRRGFRYLSLALKRVGFKKQRDLLSLKIQDLLSELEYAASRLMQELRRGEPSAESAKKDEPRSIELYNGIVDLTKNLIGLYEERSKVPVAGTPTLTAGMVKEEIAKKTGVAAGQLALGHEPMDKYLRMEEIMGQRVIGQDEALHMIAEAVRANKAGLSDPNRPLGVFYLTGPTGSGKTFLAKELARFLFGDPEAVIRLDMSEYMQDHESSKMTGAPPGYTGYDEGGQLTEKVRRRPYSVLLLDEIEKAHPKVWLLLLQILGEGHLTDGHGRTVDFKNTFILMTSNLGMFAVDVTPYEEEYRQLKARLDSLGPEAASDRADVETRMSALARRLAAETKAQTRAVTARAFRETYPPEFEGRLHAPPIIFNRITPIEAEKIVELNFKELAEILAHAGHALEWTPSVAGFLSREGFSIALGARPLKNALQRLVVQPIAAALLRSAVENGGPVRPSLIQLSLENGAVQIAVRPLPPKTVVKKEAGEGAAQELFAKVFNAVLETAANDVLAPLTVSNLDQWAMESLGMIRPTATAPAAASDAPNPTGGELPITENFFGANEPIFLPNAIVTNAEHYNAEAKDPAVNQAFIALMDALLAQGYSQEARRMFLGQDPTESEGWVGGFKLFVQQAKAMTPEQDRQTPVRVAYEVTPRYARLVVHRNGGMGPREQAFFKDHFTGPVPSTSREARDRAEALNVQGKDGRRLFFELYRFLSSIPGARLGYAEGENAKGGRGTDYWIEIPKLASQEPPTSPETLAATETPSSLASPTSPTQTENLLSAPDGLRSNVKKFVLALLRQGDQRGSTVRMAAAETLAELAGPEDLVLARDWIRFENMESHYPEVMAAASILARFGNRSDDEYLFLMAIDRLNDPKYQSHRYNPVKAKLAEALASLLAIHSDLGLTMLIKRYEQENHKPDYPPSGSDVPHLNNYYRRPVLMGALYLALTRQAGESLRFALLDMASTSQAAALYDYIKRVEPAHLADMLAAWRKDEPFPTHPSRFNHIFRQQIDRALLLYTVGDQGTMETPEGTDDLSKMLELVRTAWNGELDLATTPIAAEAFARLVARLDAYDRLKSELRLWLRESLGTHVTFSRLQAAVKAAGEAGDEEDLPLLEAILNTDPSDHHQLDNVHEITQHDAAAAWAKIVNRRGLMERYLSENLPAPDGQPSLPKIQTMLKDVNPLQNKAALEALRIHLARSR